MYTLVTELVWSEDNLHEWILYFYYVGSGN